MCGESWHAMAPLLESMHRRQATNGLAVMNTIETLESRQLMSLTAYFNGHTLHVEGDRFANDIYVERVQSNGIDQLRVTNNGAEVEIELPAWMSGGLAGSVQASLVDS